LRYFQDIAASLLKQPESSTKAKLMDVIIITNINDFHYQIIMITIIIIILNLSTVF